MQADADEIAKFDSLADQWWDHQGPMAPLHKLNPTRLAWIRDQLMPLRKHAAPPLRPLKDLTILDVGCGAGLASEPMAKMGAAVIGIDLAENSLNAARTHAQHHNIKVDYRNTSLDDIAAQGLTFDAVTCLEVIEHVPEQDAFIETAARCVRPGGMLIASTLSKSGEAFLKAIIGAEYLLGWLPRGTHDWRQFVKPSDMARMMRSAGLQVTSMTGFDYDASQDRFNLCQSPNVNYMMSALK